MIDLPKAFLHARSFEAGPEEAGEDEAFASWREPTERLVQAQAVTLMDKLLVAGIAAVFALGALAGPSARETGSGGPVPPQAVAVRAVQDRDACCVPAPEKAGAREAHVARKERPA